MFRRGRRAGGAGRQRLRETVNVAGAIAALAGLPPHAAVAVTVTLLLAVPQTLAGAWLARAILPAAPRRAS